MKNLKAKNDHVKMKFKVSCVGFDVQPASLLGEFLSSINIIELEVRGLYKKLSLNDASYQTIKCLKI
jgi:hypothetical protein